MEMLITPQLVNTMSVIALGVAFLAASLNLFMVMKAIREFADDEVFQYYRQNLVMSLTIFSIILLAHVLLKIVYEGY